MMKCACGIWFALMALVHAGLDFPEVLKEINAPADAKIVTAEFEFTNHTDQPVKVAKVDPTCSCIAVKIKGGKLLYAPGESGVIRAEFDMGNFAGTVDKVVAVWLEGDPEDKPSVALTVRVHIPELVIVEPRTLKWDVGSVAEPKSILVRMDYSQPIHIKDALSSQDNFKLEIKTREEGKQYEIIVTPADTSEAALAVIRIETDCDLKKHRIKLAFANIRKPDPAEQSGKP